MASTESKLQRLHEAGIIVAQKFSESDKKVIEQITDEEIDVLVKLRKRMGSVPEGKDHLRPNIPV
ncbi:MAG TPA: aroma-sacti cluster domain-containing protein [Acidobacteriaceae bacterium]|nr:aroma-sacti cluster domain-containing protein [Acidobacteriaceae bacterium]